MTRVPSAATTWKSREPAEPPAIGVIGGRESSSTHMGGSLGREGSRGSARPSTGDHCPEIIVLRSLSREALDDRGHRVHGTVRDDVVGDRVLLASTTYLVSDLFRRTDENGRHVEHLLR